MKFIRLMDFAREPVQKSVIALSAARWREGGRVVEVARSLLDGHGQRLAGSSPIFCPSSDAQGVQGIFCAKDVTRIYGKFPFATLLLYHSPLRGHE